MTKKLTKDASSISPEKVKREGFDTGFTSFSHYGSSGGGATGHASGYSAGSGLRSIAQGSADQAHSIVSSQHLAANQAAYVGKVIEYLIKMWQKKIMNFL